MSTKLRAAFGAVFVLALVGCDDDTGKRFPIAPSSMPKSVSPRLHIQRIKAPDPVAEIVPVLDLDHYAAFSKDGLAFAYADDDRVLRFISATTNTEEKALPLKSDEARRVASQGLADDGFPAEPQATIPKGFATGFKGEAVFVTLSGAPVSRAYRPSRDAVIQENRATLLAVSADGKRAAMRIDEVVSGMSKVERYPFSTEVHIFTLFE